MKDQTLLNIISSTLSLALSSPLLPEHLQSLKTHLYNRSFAEAFPTSTLTNDEKDIDGQQAVLETYVVRWVPTRALCYARIFERIASFLPKSSLQVTCIGAGCGSETLALQASLSCQLNVNVIDSCPGWEPILASLTDAANEKLSPAKVNFHHADIVTEHTGLLDLFSTSNLVTMMFTFNELITSHGKVAATKLMLALIKQIPAESMILIVDSPTYSVVEVAGKKFPASFLVDRLPGLEKLWEVESEWFRVEKELDYPIQLENMRYFGRLMKKKGKPVFSEATGST